MKLLFISYKFVKGFLATTYLVLFFFRNETNMMSVNVSYVVRNEIPAGSDKREIIYIDIYRHDVTKVGDFYKGGIWGNFSFFVGSN